jgi:asparagine synthase (glutamine-hydrolysing)
MSVQAGIWNIGGQPIQREAFRAISDSLVEFGPDGEATHVSGEVGMLYRPFHTTSTSRLEHQPYICSDNKAITWDGRLDNRKELLESLSEDLSEDLTDVAIVAAAFERWSTDCFSKLIGDWALSVWNPQEKELVLARDYIGIRHLFYHLAGDTIIWCNHLAPLALSGHRLSVCDEYVAGYLAFHPEADLTPYREIRSVPPGKFIRLRGRRVSTHGYWSFKSLPTVPCKTEMDYNESFVHLFRQAVRRRLRTDSPVLAELSGGLDSSSIVCMADDILGREGGESPRLDTFSYYDSREPGEDEMYHFTKVEEKRGKQGLHADLNGSGASLCFDYPTFPATPGFGSRAELKAALAEIIERREYRVMLCGTGGDEVNGQPLDARVLLADLLLHARGFEFAKGLKAWSLRMRRPAIQLLFQSLLILCPISIRARLTHAAKVEPWIKPTFARKHRMSARQLGVVDGLRFVSPAVRDAVQTIVTLGKRMTYVSPSPIESRYPYLDQNLVEFLTTIPLNQLIRPGQRRVLMRRALRDILPPEIVSRKTKASAGRCYSVALERDWEKIDQLFVDPLTSAFGYVHRDKIHAALRDMKNGQVPPSFLRLLKTLSLEAWLRNAISREIISMPGGLASTVETHVHSGAW